MFLRVLIGTLLIGAIAGSGGQKMTTPLPAEWHGTWKGMLIIASGDKSSEVAMALKIEPIKDTNEATWEITYGEGDKASLRNYKIVPDGDKAGRFKIDERNGILLDTRLVNNVMYSQFEINGNQLTARYELRGDTLRVEITSARPAAEKTGGGKVQGYQVELVQTAELKKK